MRLDLLKNLNCYHDECKISRKSKKERYWSQRWNRIFRKTINGSVNYQTNIGIYKQDSQQWNLSKYGKFDLLLSFCPSFVCSNIQWSYSTSDDNAITTSNSLFALTHSLSDPQPRVAIYHLHIKIPKISGFHLWFGLSAFANKRVKFSDNDQLHGLILNIILTNTSAP